MCLAVIEIATTNDAITVTTRYEHIKKLRAVYVDSLMNFSLLIYINSRAIVRFCIIGSNSAVTIIPDNYIFDGAT